MDSKEYQLIDDHFASIKELMNTQFKGINDRLDKLNGKVFVHDQKISELEKTELAHILNCPISPKLRALEDEMLTQKSVKTYMKWLAGVCLAIGGLVVGIIELLLN